METFYSFVLHDEVDKYSRLLQKVESYTSYHTPQYLLAEERAEESPTNILVYDDGARLALLPSIKRDVGAINGLEKFSGYYDLKTPHEYSSVLTSDSSDRLCIDFFNALDQYCHDNDIIFQFIRFNPYRPIDSKVAEQCGYNVILSDHQISVNLEGSLETIFASYSSNARRNVRIAGRKELCYVVAENTHVNIKIFHELYRLAMMRLNAKPFFYFNEDYFLNLLSDSSHANLIFVKHAEEVIAGAILLLGENCAYYHLGCFDFSKSIYRPMDYLFDALIRVSKSYGKKILHLGGGNPSLKRFKRKFSDKEVDYYIACKIFNTEMYKKICDEYIKINVNVDVSFMPLYRGAPPPPSKTNI